MSADPAVGLQDTPPHGLLLPQELSLAPATTRYERESARSNLVHLNGHLGSYWRWLRAERSLRQVQRSAPGLRATRLQQLEEAALPNPTLRTLLSVQMAYGCGSLDELLGPTHSSTWARLYVLSKPEAEHRQ